MQEAPVPMSKPQTATPKHTDQNDDRGVDGGHASRRAGVEKAPFTFPSEAELQ